MATTFNYTISTDTANGKVVESKLHTEIVGSSITIALDGVNTSGDSMSVVFKADLSAGEETTLNSLVAAHDGEPVVEEVKSVVQVESTQAFASKTLPDGRKLFKRVHGVSGSVANNTINIDLSVPYSACKVTGVELINGAPGDHINLKVLDTPTGTISTVPNYELNQFGHNVYIAKDLHKEVSSYDADLIQDMKLRVEYTSADTKDVYINFILHEVVS